MTATYAVPPRVAANIARRHAAALAGPCLYGCRAHARLYAAGWRCDVHAPQPINPTPDPTRTLAGLQSRGAA
jgi:hypothetical protein